MEISLLTTKFNIPPTRPQLVVRPQLSERLQEGLNYSLILVSAPAGFGKTTLVSEWIRHSQSQVRAAWFSLDEGDNDPIRFWNYFIAALRTLQPNCGEKVLPLFHSSQTPLAEQMLDTLINDIAIIKGDFLVILDDYHLIDSKPIHNGIIYVIEHIPVQMHLVIVARADPPLPLALFRGRGILMEIGTDDLRFALEDADSLFKELKTPELSTEEVVALNERAEGWVVGLKMAAISLRGRKDISAFITDFTGSHRYIMDYLLEEVLQKQTPEIREFLCKTSVLKRLNAPLCDAITGREDSQPILTELEREHLFIVPLDDSRQWYRYEHLFSDLLQHQCQMAYGSEQVIDLHKKASHWYENNNMLDDAIYHSLAVKDWKTAMRLIYDRSEELRKNGEFSTLIGWLQIIPEELLRTHLRLYSQYASCLTVVSKFDAAEAALNYLESVTMNDVNLQGEVAFSLSNIARMRGDFPRSIEMAEKALSVLPPESVAMRARTNWNLGYVLYNSGSLHEAEVRLTEAYKLGLQAKDVTVAGAAMMVLGSIIHFSGRLRYAIDILEKTREAGRIGNRAGVLLTLSKVLYELNDLEKAAEDVRLSIEWIKLSGIAESLVLTFFSQARIFLALGDEAGATAAIAKMDDANRHPTVAAATHASHIACHTLLSIYQNHMETATEWGRKLIEYHDILHLQFQYIPARLFIAQRRKKEAAELLRDLYERLVQVGAHGLAIGVRVCQVLAAETEESALEFLTDGLIKGEPEGFIRSFVDEGALIKPLLEKALSIGITPEYTRKLVDIIEAEERLKQKVKRGESIHSASLTLLSQRELEVLRLIAEDLSNQQITDRLIISISTTKNHVHNILEKLNVRDRSQAVFKARELNLI